MARKLASDRVLFAAVILLVLTGLLMIYSASAMQIYLPTAGAPAFPYFFLAKQGIAVLLGVGLMAGAHFLDYRQLNRPPLVVAGLVLALPEAGS